MRPNRFCLGLIAAVSTLQLRHNCAMASQITSLAIIYSTVYSGADQRKHQNSASLAFVWAIHQGPVNSPHKWPVMRKMFPFDDVIMTYQLYTVSISWDIQCTSTCTNIINISLIKVEIINYYYFN